MGSFLKERKAQISAEMIIVLAALIAVAVVLISKLTSTSKQAADSITKKSDDLIKNINDFNA